jgi:hypothetical protein
LKYQALTLLLLILAGVALVMNACTGGPTYGSGSPFVPLPSSPTIVSSPGTVVAVPTSTKTHTPVPTVTRTHTPVAAPTSTFTLAANLSSTPTRTATKTQTPTITATPSVTSTVTATQTLFFVNTATVTSTPTSCVVVGGNQASVGTAAASGSVLDDFGTYVSGPFGITQSAAVTGLEIFSTSAPGTVHLGLYQDGGSGTLPITVVYESPLVNISVAGTFVYDLSATPVTLCPGSYWTAIASPDTSTSILMTEADTTFVSTVWTASSVFPNNIQPGANTGFGPVMQILYDY